jgi:uncharacterized protein
VLTGLAGALVIGLSLGLLGSGGSILTVPVLHYLFGQPEQAAIGGSLLVVGSIAAVAVVPHALARRVAWSDVAWFGVPGMAGAWFGATLAQWIPGTVQLGGFALTMFVAGWRMLAAQPLDRGPGAPALTMFVAGAPGPRSSGCAASIRQPATGRRFAIVGGGAAVGLASGIVGVGGGFLIVPALVLLARVPMTQAVGTSLAIITLNSFVGFARYLDVLQDRGVALDWGTLALVTGLGIAGSLLGHRLAARTSQTLLRKIFGWTLLLLATAIGLDVARRVLA